jgi:hypothetical protein
MAIDTEWATPDSLSRNGQKNTIAASLAKTSPTSPMAA